MALIIPSVSLSLSKTFTHGYWFDGLTMTSGYVMGVSCGRAFRLYACPEGMPMAQALGFRAGIHFSQ
ncbi:hypothetical protein [Mucilaginibacter conchicola]|uniref:hypothetical protein n=1 Tax=Mucilaginibacter conchicola TaxID=2303333 RepID=UPI0011C1712D|nr:hypothetical protein [Mucilaginibacter conchicola]